MPNLKAEWRDYNWPNAPFPEREGDYYSYRVLMTPDGVMLASVENFKSYPSVHYANIWEPKHERGGPMSSQLGAEQWCENRTGNKVN